MKIETTRQIIPLGLETENADGTVDFVPNGETTTVDIVDIYAEEGCLFRNKVTGVTVSRHITIGGNDSVENYEEVKTWH